MGAWDLPSSGSRWGKKNRQLMTSITTNYDGDRLDWSKGLGLSCLDAEDRGL